MEIISIKSVQDSRYGKALALYEKSFPWEERREAPAQARILGDRDYHFCTICEEEKFVGGVFFWETEAFLYVEHLFILPELRNQQYGKRVLEWLKGREKQIILEIEPPEDEVTRRRQNFYLRGGFQTNDYPYVQLPYHRGSPECPLVLMSYPGAITRGEFQDFCQYLKTRVMKENFA